MVLVLDNRKNIFVKQFEALQRFSYDSIIRIIIVQTVTRKILYFFYSEYLNEELIFWKKIENKLRDNKGKFIGRNYSPSRISSDMTANEERHSSDSRE